MLPSKPSRDTSNFKIDEYEQSAEEFEKYVQSIDRKPSAPRAKQTDLLSAVLEYINRYKGAEGNDLQTLCGVLKALRDWGADDSQKELNKQIYQVQTKLALLAQKHSEFGRQLVKLEAQLQSLQEKRKEKLRDSQGILSSEDLDARLNKFAIQISQNLQLGRDNSTIMEEIERLKALRPAARQTEIIDSEVKSLESEVHSVEKFLKVKNMQDTADDYQSLKIREKFLLSKQQ